MTDIYDVVRLEARIVELEKELAATKAEYLRRDKLAGDRFVQIIALKELNAELRTALRYLCDNPSNRALLGGGRPHLEAYDKARAILAKSESQSALTPRGAHLPAQDPSVCHHRPAPGGTSTETQTG